MLLQIINVQFVVQIVLHAIKVQEIVYHAQVHKY